MYTLGIFWTSKIFELLGSVLTLFSVTGILELCSGIFFLFKVMVQIAGEWRRQHCSGKKQSPAKSNQVLPESTPPPSGMEVHKTKLTSLDSARVDFKRVSAALAAVLVEGKRIAAALDAASTAAALFSAKYADLDVKYVEAELAALTATALKEAVAANTAHN